MNRIRKIPTGSSIEAELHRGKVYTRTGTRGQATILFDRASGEFVVLADKDGTRRAFTRFSQALRNFRMVGGV